MKQRKIRNKKLSSGIRNKELSIELRNWVDAISISG
jgi:hypothetical protein